MKKIPDNAKKVFEGIFFSVWQWEQKLFDGSLKTFEYASRPHIVSVIAVTNQGKVLLLKEEQPAEKETYTFPSGVVEKEETCEVTAKRELLEETGYDSNQIQEWFSKDVGARVDSEYHVFIARDCVRVKDQKLDPGEKISVEEVELDNLLESIEKIPFKNSSIYPFLIKAKYDKTYKEEFRQLLGITT